MAISFGSFTITDFNDSISLSGYISSNLSKYQIYSPDNDSYEPDWSVTNLVLTPELYITSMPNNIIENAGVQSVKWYKDSESSPISTGGAFELSGSKSHILTVKSNILSSLNGVTFTCVIVYNDSTTGLSLTHKMDISLTKVSSGGGIADALATTPHGNIFKNSSIESLTAECFLWKGSKKDETNVSYQWYAQDTGEDDGWLLLTDTPNKYTGVKTSTITVYASAVLNVQVFKCVITDTDTEQEYQDYVSFVDLSDPIQCIIESTGGDVFKNGAGSTTLKARLFQAGVEIDSAGTKYTYKWYKYDKDSELVPDFGGSGTNYKTGKTLSVGASDVDVKSTFKVEVE